MSVKFSESQLMIMSQLARASGLSLRMSLAKCSVIRWLHAGVPSAISSSHSVTGHFLSPIQRLSYSGALG